MRGGSALREITDDDKSLGSFFFVSVFYFTLVSYLTKCIEGLYYIIILYLIGPF